MVTYGLTVILFILQKSKRAHKHLKDNNEDIGEKLANTDMECGEMMMSIHPNKG